MMNRTPTPPSPTNTEAQAATPAIEFLPPDVAAAGARPPDLSVIDALPTLAGVLGSMDHWDHFDVEHFATYLDHTVPIIVPAGTTQRDQARKVGLTDVRALTPWRTAELGSFRITAVSAKPAAPTTAWEYEHADVIERSGHRVLFCSHIMEPRFKQKDVR